MNELLQGLNQAQREAVTATEGFVRVIAGAGSGKTRALAHRFAYLVREIGILPGNILCVTFTNKAASEMRARIHSLTGDNDTGMICTFHSFCVTVLHEEIHAVGYPKSFLVLDNADIDAICSTMLQDRIFDMVEATTRHRTKEALALYYDLLALKVSPLQILAMLARQYNLMLQAKELRSQGLRDKEIATKIGVPPFVVSKYISQASSYKASELRSALEKCVQADADVKMGLMNDKLSVELIILGDRT